MLSKKTNRFVSEVFLWKEMITNCNIFVGLYLLNICWQENYLICEVIQNDLRFIYSSLPSLFFLVLCITFSGTLLHMEHLKHPVCHLWPPASFSSAAYTDFPHFGHFGISIGLKGIFFDFSVSLRLTSTAHYCIPPCPACTECGL